MRFVAAFSASFVVVLACAVPSADGTPIAGHYTPAAGTQVSVSSSCAAPAAPKPALESAPACCAGAGHCAKTATLGANDRALYGKDACTLDTQCVPNSEWTTGTGHGKTCTSVGGVPGRCASKCVPDVAKNASALPDDTCVAGAEKCVPCINPLTNSPSGACADVGGPAGLEAPAGASSDSCNGDNNKAGPVAPVVVAPIACPYLGKALLDPNAFAMCAAGAHCLAAALVTDAKQAAELGSCTTKDGSPGLCAPDVAIRTGGNFVPKTCASVGGVEGRCLNSALPKIAAQASMLSRGACEAEELCAPCFSPLDGTSTGACTQSCDPGPKGPAVEFGQCCGGAGRCVPSSLVPASKREKLAACHGAAGGNLCAPNETLAPDYAPTSCEGFALLLGGRYSGACVSECVPTKFFQNLVLKQGTCNAGAQCVPCEQRGVSTGACEAN